VRQCFALPLLILLFLCFVFFSPNHFAFPMLVSSVERSWLSHGDPPPGLVIAVSGGPDSVALLRALLAVRGNRPIPLVVAHLNHQLRGTDSDADETFVIARHAELVENGATLLHLARHRLDVAALAAEQGANLEAIARRERYRWLAEVALSHGLHHVATGHTANDQAETLLHRLLRGTGLEGLRGIAFRRELSPGIEAVRPLLHVTREQVQAYLTDLGQSARHDASNDDPRFTRNRIRHELLPLLAQQYNPRIVEVLARLAEQAGEAFAEEETVGAVLLQQTERPRAGVLVVLDIASLRQGSPRAVRSALRLLWQREGWPMAEMGFDHWQRLADLVDAESGAHHLPGGVGARRRGGVLQLQGPAVESEQHSNQSSENP
jgi:tRNA(Ile)-lysidine synthase